MFSLCALLLLLFSLMLPIAANYDSRHVLTATDVLINTPDCYPWFSSCIVATVVLTGTTTATKPLKVIDVSFFVL